jgi:hypothetical protein
MSEVSKPCASAEAELRTNARHPARCSDLLTNLPKRIRPSGRLGYAAPMSFSVTAYHANRPLTVTAETAKEAFAKAVEWHVVNRFTNISICDGVKSYSIDGFASVMALKEIANTVEAAAERGPKAEVK